MSMLDVVHWLTDPSHWSGDSGIPVRVGQHLWMSFLAMVIAAALALPVGLVVGHRRRFEALFEGRRQPAEALFELDVRAGHAGTSLATESGPSRPRSLCTARWTRTRAAISLAPTTSPISAKVRPSK